MGKQTSSDQSNTARDNRAIVVAMLLRQGWSPRAVGDALKEIDRSGDPGKALRVLMESRRS